MTGSEGVRVQRSFTNRVAIGNNRVGLTGLGRMSVLWLEPGPPPKAKISVAPMVGPDSVTYDVEWGGTFPIGEETWRFVDVEFENRSEWYVTVERVEPGAPPTELPPLTGSRLWLPIEMRPYGTLQEEQVAALEADLDLALPPMYREWLMETNGVQPVEPYVVPGMHIMVAPERPLYGLHPDYLPFDLRYAEQTRRNWLPHGYVVIGEPYGGLLVLNTVYRPVAPPEAIAFLPEPAMLGPDTPEASAIRETHLAYVGRSIWGFYGRLQPAPPPPGPPATLEYPNQ